MFQINENEDKIVDLLPCSQYSLNHTLNNFFLFLDFKKLLAGMKFSDNGEVIAESVNYFKCGI